MAEAEDDVLAEMLEHNRAFQRDGGCGPGAS
jgi:hypothetical protein